MISAYIQASLATMFAILAVWEWQIRRNGGRPNPNQQRLFDAFSGTLGLFVNTSLVQPELSSRHSGVGVRVSRIEARLLS